MHASQMSVNKNQQTDWATLLKVGGADYRCSIGQSAGGNS